MLKAYHERGFMNNLKDRVTIYQVAQAANVSLATVSRVINKKGNVTEETRKRVEKTIAELGYKPSALAQALATSKSTTIGIIIPTPNYVYISNLLTGLTEVAKDLGFIVTLFTTSRSRDETLNTIERVITSHVDGAIIFDDELDYRDIETINSYHVPTIVINSRMTGEQAGSLAFNYDNIIIDLIDKFYATNLEGVTPTFLHVHNGGRLVSKCEKAFIDYHASKNLPYHIVNCDDSYLRTYADFKEYFKTHKDGMFFCNRDSIAAAILNAATESGLDIPNDVQVLSIVGGKYAHIIKPYLSAVYINMKDVGRRAMYMLDELIKGQLTQKTYTFEGKYEKRDSTRF